MSRLNAWRMAWYVTRFRTPQLLDCLLRALWHPRTYHAAIMMQFARWHLRSIGESIKAAAIYGRRRYDD